MFRLIKNPKKNINKRFVNIWPQAPVKSHSIIVDHESKYLREIAPLPPVENLALKGGGV